jgi:hypothetical protein
MTRRHTTATLVVTTLAAAAVSGFSTGRSDVQAPSAPAPPQFKVDPFWPKPFPAVKDAEGHLHRWATGEIGGTCVDSHDHIFTLNRGWQNSSLGKLHTFEAMSSVPAPPVVAYDPDGNVVTSWGDASHLAPNGGTKVMPESLHGCFVDSEDNVWIGGNADGVVQKYTHDGKLLLQIGTKGVCDGKAPVTPGAAPIFFPTCTSGLNSNRTMLNDPADIAVDANRIRSRDSGSVTSPTAGNHRIVSSMRGRISGNGDRPQRPHQFAEGGGHPHFA